MYSLHSNHVEHSVFCNTSPDNHPAAAAAAAAEIFNIKPVQIKHNHSQEVFSGFEIGKAVHKVSTFDPRIRVLLCLCFFGFFPISTWIFSVGVSSNCPKVRLTGDHLCPGALATHLGHIIWCCCPLL